MSPAQYKALEWLANGSTGVSSKTMCFWLAFGIRMDRHSHPYDPSDLDRCLRFLAAVPEARQFLPRMAELSPDWAALIARWADVEHSHLDEVGLGWTKGYNAPKTYALMTSVLSQEAL